MKVLNASRKICQLIKFSKAIRVPYRTFTDERQFDEKGRIMMDKKIKMLADPIDPFGLGEFNSNKEIFALLEKANYSYSLNELLNFLERLEELNRSNMGSFMASKQAHELFRVIKAKLKQLEVTIQPYAKRSFADSQPTPEELIEWAEREHERVMAKTNIPRVGRLSVLLNAIKMFDSEIWSTMEKLILGHQADNSLLETISAMEGFCSFERILGEQEAAFQKLEAKYSPGLSSSVQSPVALLQNSSYFIPRSIVAKKTDQQSNDENVSLSKSEIARQNRTAEIRKRVRKVYRVLERNMIVAMTDINVSHYARAIKALNETQSPNKVSFELLEYHTITNISLINDPRLVLKVYVEFARSGHGSDNFFRAIESIFCEGVVTDLRLSDFANYLNNAENLGKLLEARSQVMERIPEMTMNVDLAAKICAYIRSHRFEYRCVDIGKLLRHLDVIQLPENEAKELQGKLVNDLIKALPNEVESFRDFLQIFESVRDRLAGHQKERLLAAFINIAKNNRTVVTEENWDSFCLVAQDELTDDGLRRLGFSNPNQLDSSSHTHN